MQPRDGMRGVARPKIARRSREEEGVRETEEDESEEENGRTWRVPGRRKEGEERSSCGLSEEATASSGSFGRLAPTSR